MNAEAETLNVTNQPPPNAGWECYRDVHLPARPADFRVFRAEITFTATASNNVQMAFGKDADKDGKLPAEETSATIGWDRGAWFILSGDLKTRYTSSPQNGAAATSRTLRISVRVNASGIPASLIFRDQNGSAVAFSGLEGVPSWISPKDWDMAALTARGWDVRDEEAKISFVLDGTHILLR